MYTPAPPVNTPRVLCLGEVLWDCLADQPGQPRESVSSWTRYLGGAPANVACALVKLGTPSAFIGCVGEDAAGKAIIEQLQALGVNIQGIQQHPQAPTREVFVTRTLTGDRQFVGFNGEDSAEFADTRLAAEYLPQALFAGADYLVLGTLELAYPQTCQAIHAAIALAKQHHLKIFVDVNWRPIFWTDAEEARSLINQLLQQTDLLKLSEEEAEWLFSTADPAAIYQQWSAASPSRTEPGLGILVTKGEQGCAYWLAGHQGEVPAFAVNSVDTTGAGDSFVAGFLHQLCMHSTASLSDPLQARQIVEYASAVGALTTTKPGAIAAQPTAAEVVAFLEKH
jgi:fructokinase